MQTIQTNFPFRWIMEVLQKGENLWQWQMRALSSFSSLLSPSLRHYMRWQYCHVTGMHPVSPCWMKQDVADAHRFFQPAGPALRPGPGTKDPAACSDWLTKQMPPVAQNMSVNARGHSYHACLFIRQGGQGGSCILCVCARACAMRANVLVWTLPTKWPEWTLWPNSSSFSC